MNENIEKRSSSWAANDEGKISGYAVVFENRTLLYRDPETGSEFYEVIDRHALDNADLSDVILRYDHEGHVLARTRNNSLNLSIDDKGLKIEADMTQSEEARKFYEEVKSGLIDKMSFAFVVAPAGDEYDSNTRTRRIKNISRLFDVSIVSFPAYEATEVSARNAVIPYAEAEKEDREIRDIAKRALLICSEMHIDPDSFCPDEDAYDLDDPKDAMNYQRDNIAYCAEALQDCRSLAYAEALIGAIEKARAAIKSDAEERAKIRQLVAAGAGEIRETVPSEAGSSFSSYSNNPNRSNDMNIETKEFYNNLLLTRTASSASSMTAVIPKEITDNYVIENAPGAFLKYAQVTSIPHAGTINIPVAALQTVSAHTENAAVTDNGYVPGAVSITHSEYIYKTAYSDLGVTVSAANFQEIIENVCLQSAFKAMDGICLGAIAGATYTDGTNAVEVTHGSAPSYAEYMELAGYLGSDFVPKAKWFMAPGTYFGWLLGLKDTANRPILDASKKVEDQAFCGFGIELDAQIPANVIYFGDAGRIHLNYGRDIEVKAWDDLDYNQHKVAVRCVAGAAAESGCMVKMYEAAS